MDIIPVVVRKVGAVENLEELTKLDINKKVDREQFSALLNRQGYSGEC